jgi:opacity protein-like surface antigen
MFQHSTLTKGVIMYRILWIGLLVASTAAAEIENVVPYLSVSGGLATLDDGEFSTSGVDVLDISYKEGYLVEAAAGVTLDKGLDTHPMRVELALSYQENDLDEVRDQLGGVIEPGDPAGTKYSADETVEILALMLNGYLDYPTAYGLTPFVMVGIGGARIDYEVDDDTVLAGQVGGGVAYALTEGLTLDLKYKFFLTEKVELLKTLKDNGSGHHLQLGLRMPF